MFVFRFGGECREVKKALSLSVPSGDERLNCLLASFPDHPSSRLLFLV